MNGDPFVPARSIPQCGLAIRKNAKPHPIAASAARLSTRAADLGHRELWGVWGGIDRETQSLERKS
ncbi:hypothetical protein M6D93_12300 [Jatrophihabitans telluris]|uniref:Uncharacterized protein n=1 Tax=Jatrophihabitans telluris TaxID=2038343 RepID=A0ABY4QUH7_9ACTN|nr:hypothetical protein [Jatrophihabitans telluris]UQX87083.1 hypothetical protein M6D93_12300 [Jatrophihabitans telluris]